MTRAKRDLEQIGFRSLALWRVDAERLSYEIDTRPEEAKELLDAPNALYAFCRGEEVLYIGKTTRSIRTRFTGYCRPSATQATNLRCNAAIREAGALGETIAILAFSPSDKLQFAGLPINLAAGLEDALIAHFAPPWNGIGPGRRPVTETAAIEAEETSPEGSGTGEEAQAPDHATFTVMLNKTYYEGDIINPGIAHARCFGGDGEMVTVFYSDGAPPSTKHIDRRNAGPGAVRLRGGARETRSWIRRHFSPGEVLRIRILGPNAIELIAPPESAGAASRSSSARS